MAAGTAASSGLLTDIGVAVPHMPATVLAALADAGEYPDLYHGDNLSKVDPELWKSNWWYQRDLDVPRGHSRYTLTFNGINYRGEVWVNGVKVADQDELGGHDPPPRNRHHRGRLTRREKHRCREDNS